MELRSKVGRRLQKGRRDGKGGWTVRFEGGVSGTEEDGKGGRLDVQRERRRLGLDGGKEVAEGAEGGEMWVDWGRGRRGECRGGCCGFRGSVIGGEGGWRDP